FMEFIESRAPDLKAALTAKYGSENSFSLDRFINDFCIFGSPETVTSRIKELEEKVNLDYLLCSLNLITQDHSFCIRSMELFAKEVMPAFTSPRKEEPVR
ncbi:MAG: hypothetical protein ACRENF_07525, partial [Thermodesulfobacteriota bacterium]